MRNKLKNNLMNLTSARDDEAFQISNHPHATHHSSMIETSSSSASSSTPRRALITGITGQDGAYLSHFLLKRGYQVSGLMRPKRRREDRQHSVTTESSNLVELGIVDQIEEFQGNLGDKNSLCEALARAAPDEIYHLAAQSSVGESLHSPSLTAQVTGMGASNILEAWREECPQARFFMASSSEIFGSPRETPQRETTSFAPRNPYGAAKLFAHSLAGAYREAYGLHVSCGILFNHESPLRHERFVTRKVTRGVARIKLGLQHELQLGDLSVERDWGFAGDYVAAMWMMLQNETPDDYVLATGRAHVLQEWVEKAFASVDLDWRDWVQTDQKLMRSVEIAAFVGDASKASTRLGWKPRVDFDQLVRLMVEADMAREQGQDNEVSYFLKEKTQ